MGILEERLWGLARKHAEGRRVLEVVRGVRYTAALLEGGRLGLSYSYARAAARGERCMPLLMGLPVEAEALLDLSTSEHLGDRAVALAVANGVLPVEGELTSAMPPVESGEEVLLVGFMEPLARRLREKGVRVFTLDDQEKQGIPLDRGLELAVRVDRVVLTASAIANRTWERFVERAKDCWVVGPSTPLCWEIYADTSVSAVMGRSVKHAPELLKAVSRGAGTRLFDPFTDRVLLCAKGLCV